MIHNFYSKKKKRKLINADMSSVNSRESLISSFFYRAKLFSLFMQPHAHFPPIKFFYAKVMFGKFNNCHPIFCIKNIPRKV